jgi:hypothetical protein
MKHEHIQEAARDAKQMEENSILSGDPLLETCTCTRYETNPYEMCDYCQAAYGRRGDGHDSDCATHDAPAYPAGECDCSSDTLIDALKTMQAEDAARYRWLLDNASYSIRRKLFGVEGVPMNEHKASDLNRLIDEQLEIEATFGNQSRNGDLG